MSSGRPGFPERVEIIESAYEYMLAYAAQGRDSEETGAGGVAIRDVLADLSAALDSLSDSVIDVESESAIKDFCETLAVDAANAKRAVDLVMSRSRISSQLVDNLNASIHLRSVLTDLFVIDEAFKC